MIELAIVVMMAAGLGGVDALAVDGQAQAVAARHPERAIVAKCAQKGCGFEKTFNDAAKADLFFYPPRKDPRTGKMMTVEELIMNHPPEQPVVVKCPKCGKNSVLRAMYCKKCKKYFVPHVYIFPMAEKTHHKCPTCGFDPVQERIDEYIRKKREQRERERGRE